MFELPVIENETAAVEVLRPLTFPHFCKNKKRFGNSVKL